MNYCTECGKREVEKHRGKYRPTGLCSACRRRNAAMARLDDLIIRPCAAGCGVRVHNIPYLNIPQARQGRGPGAQWCYACYQTLPAEQKVLLGTCLDCKKPMVHSRYFKEGFVNHAAKGLCRTCYNKPFQAAWNEKRRIADSKRPKRSVRIGNINAAKLTPEEVAIIKRRLLDGGRQVDIAREYKMGRTTIHDIAHGLNWAHVNPATRGN